jgi:CRP-like cAMP-binding protein
MAASVAAPQRVPTCGQESKLSGSPLTAPFAGAYCLIAAENVIPSARSKIAFGRRIKDGRSLHVANLDGLLGILQTWKSFVRSHAQDALQKRCVLGEYSVVFRVARISRVPVSRIWERFSVVTPVSQGRFVESKGLQVVQSGERTNTEGKPVGNLILLSASDSDYSSLRPHLEYVSLPNHLVLHEGGGKLEFAYFPNGGLISLVVVMKDGKTAEAGIVGNEGFTGTPAAVGLSRSPLRAVVQITGDGFRVEVAALQNTLESTPHLQLLLSRYAVVQGMQVAQTAACNRLHDIKQRLARWLLMTQDRVDSESLPITHDFLATMLGTDRPSVSLAAGILQKKKLIEYTRGAVTIVNRKKLEDSACECYGITQQYNGQLGLK